MQNQGGYILSQDADMAANDLRGGVLENGWKPQLGTLDGQPIMALG